MANDEKPQLTETGYPEEETAAYETDAGAEDSQYPVQDEEYDEEAYGAEDVQQSSSGGKGAAIAVFILVLILIFAGIVWLVKHLREGGGNSAGNTPPPAAEQQVNGGDDSFFGGDGGNADNNGAGLANVDFGGNSDNAPAQDGMQNNEAPAASGGNAQKDGEVSLENFGDDNKQPGEADDSIMVAWNKSERNNPFRPPVIEQTNSDMYGRIDGTQFEIIEPPTKLVPDENLTKLLQTQISGIMYDDESPSAIVNLAGVDQFVKIGDEIAGYKIKNITNNKVEISYKNNTYVASVGELFTKGKLEAQPAVSNLSNKFAGRNKNKNKNNAEEQRIYYEE